MHDVLYVLLVAVSFIITIALIWINLALIEVTLRMKRKNELDRDDMIWLVPIHFMGLVLLVASLWGFIRLT